jgi:hypothetical protein
MPVLLNMAKSVKLGEMSEKYKAARDVTPLSQDKENEIAQTLLEDYKYHLHKAGEERILQLEAIKKEKTEKTGVNANRSGIYDKTHFYNVFYHSVMAKDKLRGLKGFFKNSADSGNEVIPNGYGLMFTGSHSRIYSGYSESGIHVVALAPFRTYKSLDYAAAVNILRGAVNEDELLIENMRDDVWDIYIEDLSNERDKFYVDFYDERNNLLPFPDMSEHPATKKYNRLYASGGVLKDRTWYLLSGVKDPATLLVDGEYIVLYNK